MNDMELAEEIERQTKDRDAADIVLELDQWQQIIAALRRGPKRPPSGDVRDIANRAIASLGSYDPELSDYFHSALSAAEAEGRKT